MIVKRPLGKWLSLLLVSTATLWITGCGLATPPQVTDISIKPATDILVGGAASLTIEATGTNLQFKWIVTRGKLSAQTGPAVIYTAPDTPGPDIVSVEVTSDGLSTVKTASFNIIQEFSIAEGATSTPSSTQLCDDDPSRFGMCPGTVSWRVEQNDPSTRAITTVDNSIKEQAFFGMYSTRLKVNLEGGSDTNAKGEAFIDMRFSTPQDSTGPAPYDFTGQTVGCWVWAPPEAWGDPSAPNGLRLFLKDDSFDSEYSEWFNLNQDMRVNDNWFHITLPVGEGERFGEFDPTRVILLGIQFAANSTYTGAYEGSIYVDGCNW